MRGKPGRIISMTTDIRIIPARAGQTARRPVWSIRRSDHPRACGANRIYAAFTQSIYGSSPRVRGKLVLERHACALGRIIPARAGQTPGRAGASLFVSDHPRACGANGAGRRSALSRFGSSPRVRGKRRQTRPSAVSIRIIPARAGQTEWLRSRIGKYADHPRACGANYMASLSWKVGVGSSPRVRGKRQIFGPHFGRMRIIPARAGQTGEFMAESLSHSDHPRACGANRW